MPFTYSSFWRFISVILACTLALAPLAASQSLHVSMDPTGASTCSYNCYDILCTASVPCTCAAGSISVSVPLVTLPCALTFVGDVSATGLVVQPGTSNLTVTLVNGGWQSGDLTFLGSSSSTVNIKDMTFPSSMTLSVTASAFTASNVSMSSSTLSLTTPAASLRRFSTRGLVTVSTAEVNLKVLDTTVSTTGSFIKSTFVRNAYTFYNVTGTAGSWIDTTYPPSSISLNSCELSLAPSSSTNGTFFTTAPTYQLSISNTSFENNNSAMISTIFRDIGSLGDTNLTAITTLTSGSSRVIFGPSLVLTGRLSILDSFFDNEFANISWTVSASLSIVNTKFDRAANGAIRGLLAPITIANLSSSLSFCAQGSSTGSLGSLFTIDPTTDSSGAVAHLSLICNSTLDSIYLTKSTMITGSYYLAANMIAASGGPKNLALLGGASLVISNSFSLSSIHLNISDPESTLHYAPGGIGSTFSPSSLNGSMIIDSTSTIKLAPGLTNFNILLGSLVGASPALPIARQLYTVFKGASTTYGSINLNLHPWMLQVSSYSASGDLTFSFFNQACPSSCVNPNPLGCVCATVCTCSDDWSGSMCDTAVSPLESPSNAPFSSANMSFPAGSNLVFTDLSNNGQLEIGYGSRINITGTLTVDGKLIINDKLVERRSRSGHGSSDSYCVISSTTSFHADQLIFGAFSSVSINLDASELNLAESCISPPQGHSLWDEASPMFYYTSSLTVATDLAWKIIISGPSTGRNLNFKLLLLRSSGAASAHGSPLRADVVTSNTGTCSRTSNAPGSMSVTLAPCTSSVSNKGTNPAAIAISVVIGCVLIVAVVLIIVFVRAKRGKASTPNSAAPPSTAPPAQQIFDWESSQSPSTSTIKESYDEPKPTTPRMEASRFIHEAPSVPNTTADTHITSTNTDAPTSSSAPLEELSETPEKSTPASNTQRINPCTIFEEEED